METQAQLSELQQTFVKELIKQIKASDTYGSYDSYTEEMFLKPFIVTKESKKAIPQFGDITPATQNRIKQFYGAVGVTLEQKTGVMVNLLLEMNHEGWGKGILYAGKLILLEKILRDAHRFGFESLEKLAQEGESLVNKGLSTFEKFESVARD